MYMNHTEWVHFPIMTISCLLPDCILKKTIIWPKTVALISISQKSCLLSVSRVKQCDSLKTAGIPWISNDRIIQCIIFLADLKCCKAESWMILRYRVNSVFLIFLMNESLLIWLVVARGGSWSSAVVKCSSFSMTDLETGFTFLEHTVFLICRIEISLQYEREH